MTKRSESVSGDHGNRTHSVFTTNVAKYLRIKVSTRLSRPHLAIKGLYVYPNQSQSEHYHIHTDKITVHRLKTYPII